ncbi:MAG: hypothetical protein Udaeo_01590 [Candidatus Udaeobacter sp.]|nr:MAG: hypothetical protein Udaeo_01590 [Candidatus Udaeobacter sp.]
MYHEIHTYSELRQQIHHDLRMQHPEWVQSNGESPKCDSYESRLAKLLENFTRQKRSHGGIVPNHSAFGKRNDSRVTR